MGSRWTWGTVVWVAIEGYDEVSWGTAAMAETRERCDCDGDHGRVLHVGYV